MTNEYERPGDWMCCLSLMLSSDLMTSYADRIDDKRSKDSIAEREGERERSEDRDEPDENISNKVITGGRLLGSADGVDVSIEMEVDDNVMIANNDVGACVSIEVNSSSSSCSSDSDDGSRDHCIHRGHTHDLMVRVMSKAQHPPHSHLKTCIDSWLARCTGAGGTMSFNKDINILDQKIKSGMKLVDDTVSSIPYNYGLPLLQNEAYVLCQYESNNDQNSIKKEINATNEVGLAVDTSVPLSSSISGSSLCKSSCGEECKRDGKKSKLTFTKSVPLSEAVWHLLNRWKRPSHKVFYYFIVGSFLSALSLLISHVLSYLISFCTYAVLASPYGEQSL